MIDKAKKCMVCGNDDEEMVAMEGFIGIIPIKVCVDCLEPLRGLFKKLEELTEKLAAEELEGMVEELTEYHRELTVRISDMMGGNNGKSN